MPRTAEHWGSPDAEIAARIAAQSPCPWCGKRHTHMVSEEECERRVKLLCANGCGRTRHKVKGHRDPCSLCVECCTEKHGGPPGLEQPKNKQPEFLALSEEFAALMPKPEPEWIPPQSLNPKATRRFYVRSRSRPTQEHLVELLPTLLVCSCEAGRTGHRCKHKEVVEEFLLAGAREIPIE